MVLRKWESRSMPTSERSSRKRRPFLFLSLRVRERASSQTLGCSRTVPAARLRIHAVSAPPDLCLRTRLWQASVQVSGNQDRLLHHLKRVYTDNQSVGQKPGRLSMQARWRAGRYSCWTEPRHSDVHVHARCGCADICKVKVRIGSSEGIRHWIYASGRLNLLHSQKTRTLLFIVSAAHCLTSSNSSRFLSSGASFRCFDPPRTNPSAWCLGMTIHEIHVILFL